MLLRFRVANHGSIQDEQMLSLIGDVGGEYARPTQLHAADRDIEVLPAMGIFGDAGSGKSSLVDAVRFARQAVQQSATVWSAHPGHVPRHPFTFDHGGVDTVPSLFEVEVMLGPEQTRYTYGFRLSDRAVTAEWLHSYPEGAREIWFDRDYNRPDHHRFPTHGVLDDVQDLIAATRSNALFLSAGAAAGEPHLRLLADWFAGQLTILNPDPDPEHGMRTTELLIRTPHSPYHDQVIGMLTAAGLGVTDVDVGHDGRIRLHHRQLGIERSIDVDDESPATRAWFELCGPIVGALQSGGVLLVDDLDIRLHPALLAEVAVLFNSAEANTRNAQLIFTGHSTTLLNGLAVDEVLSIDQTRIAMKQPAGNTHLHLFPDPAIDHVALTSLFAEVAEPTRAHVSTAVNPHPVPISYTQRGFAVFGTEVIDTNGVSMRVQQSPSAEIDAVGLFVGDDIPGPDPHLSEVQARSLRDQLTTLLLHPSPPALTLTCTYGNTIDLDQTGPRSATLKISKRDGRDIALDLAESTMQALLSRIDTFLTYVDENRDTDRVDRVDRVELSAIVDAVADAVLASSKPRNPISAAAGAELVIPVGELGAKDNGAEP
ncbi:ATP/GTP-binding protein [Nocardia sp. XZ_19_369]|uniref:AAA family ATPase n=1 Tax=Nocardia sp. XZ_19_369 TaxID=2769487 RepID=UPI00188EF248|nr:ATP-binding protein [Nocardia sp. XZ_19_369]